MGDVVQDFTLPDLDGKPVKLSDFRGKPIVLAFFATW
ncbi:MAG: redoxin domain-containing protein [Nitrospirae bacterium]|nr:redoxin domain-containing protein [Nitrospirota bacterium]